MEKKPRKVNSRRITMDDLKPGWKTKILEMMSNGAGECEVVAEIIGSSYRAWLRLQEEDKEFRKVVQFGRVLAQAWWERRGRENLESRYFQTGLWSMNMKNRFGWTDRQTIEHEVGDSLYEKYREISSERLKERARELLRANGTDGANAAIARIGLPETAEPG